MGLRILRAAAGFTVVTAIATAGYALAASDGRYAVIALLLAVQAMILVYRAAAVQGVGCDGLSGFADWAFHPWRLSYLTLGLGMAAGYWAWHSGTDTWALTAALLCVQAAFCAHYARQHEVADRALALEVRRMQDDLLRDADA